MPSIAARMFPTKLFFPPKILRVLSAEKYVRTIPMTKTINRSNNKTFGASKRKNRTVSVKRLADCIFNIPKTISSVIACREAYTTIHTDIKPDMKITFLFSPAGRTCFPTASSVTFSRLSSTSLSAVELCDDLFQSFNLRNHSLGNDFLIDHKSRR